MALFRQNLFDMVGILLSAFTLNRDVVKVGYCEIYVSQSIHDLLKNAWCAFILNGILLNLYRPLSIFIVKYFTHSSSTGIWSNASNKSSFENTLPPFNFTNIFWTWQRVIVFFKKIVQSHRKICSGPFFYKVVGHAQSL